MVIMLSIKSPHQLLLEVSANAKKKRLELNLTQQSLAERSGVSLGSLKRFELTGEISLHSLLKLALVLGSMQEFESLFTSKIEELTLDQLLIRNKKRQRGTGK